METREYVEYLLKNYNEIVKDVEQMKFELKTFNLCIKFFKELTHKTDYM